jgi:hypothetical protein
MEDLIGSIGESISLTEGERQGLIITEDETADLRVKSGLCLIGKLMSERIVYKEALQSMMSRLWRTVESVKFKELHDNVWLLEFGNESDKRRIKEGRPWIFDRNVLVLKEIDENVPLSQMDFSHALFWVQVHDMPLLCMNREIGFRIGESMGKVEEVDVTGDGVGWGRCLRIRTYIDLSKPLNRGRALHVDGKTIWVTLKYEKLPHFCYNCGRIVHGVNSCQSEGGFRLNAAPSIKPWGPWLRAEESRSRGHRPLKGAQKEGSSGGESPGRTVADQFVGEGERAGVENQSQFPKLGSREKQQSNCAEKSGLENSVEETDEGRKEGAESLMGQGSFNVVESAHEDEGVLLDSSKGQGETNEVGTITPGFFITGHGGVHIRPNTDLEEGPVDVTKMGKAYLSPKDVDSHNMQIDVKEQKVSKRTTSTWSRRARDISQEVTIVQEGKRKRSEVSLTELGANGVENKKSKTNCLAVAEAGSQPRQPQ